jgi:cephalosporin-C deacetylase
MIFIGMKDSRKYLIVTVMLALMASGLQSQNLLKYAWKFKTGDDPAWATQGYDDSGWEILHGGTDWENQGYNTYDGFAWYRQKVTIPASLKEKAAGNGGLILKLGRIDDSDETFLNGELLGRTGKMPPEYETGYSQLRTYVIPVDKVKWGEENTFAVRVYDGGGGGGIVEGPLALSMIGLDELIKINVLMDREDHLVLDQGPVKVTLVVENGLSETLKGDLIVRGRSDFGEEVVSESHGLKVQPGGKKKIPLAIGDLDPGFYNVDVTLNSTLDNKRVEFAVGVRPEEIVSPLDRQPDFDDYWQRARRELNAVAPQFKLTRQEEYCTDTREVYLLEMRSLGNVLIKGWYMRPVAAGKYPAILHVQGYSSRKTPATLYQGDDMVSLALNIRGHGNSCDHVNPGFPGYILYNVDDKETYVYRGAYMDCIRAVDFLYSREEVDTSRVAVEGGSQGGALSFATAALDNKRIDLCVPNVPFLSDFRDYFKVASWPAGEFFQYFKEHPDIPGDSIYKTLSYIDIKNLAPWIKAPVFMSVGLKDKTCPPHINFAAYNQLDVPKKYQVYPESGHSLPREYYGMMIKYIREQFNLD